MSRGPVETVATETAARTASETLSVPFFDPSNQTMTTSLREVGGIIQKYSRSTADVGQQGVKTSPTLVRSRTCPSPAYFSGTDVVFDSDGFRIPAQPDEEFQRVAQF